MSEVRCPICEAPPGKTCFDPSGDLAYSGKHAARMDAEIKARVANRDAERQRAEIKDINRQIGSLIARRSRIEKELRENDHG